VGRRVWSSETAAGPPLVAFRVPKRRETEKENKNEKTAKRKKNRKTKLNSKFLNKFSVTHNALCRVFVAIAKTELESCCRTFFG